MSEFKTPALKELTEQQTRYAPPARRQEQVQRAEKLLDEIDAGRPYPYQYVCFRLTEYRSDAHKDLLIARVMPVVTVPRRVVIGQPGGLPPAPPLTHEQAEMRHRISRERGIDDAIKNAAISSRVCPECGYPAPDWRVDCRVCGFKIGRAIEG